MRLFSCFSVDTLSNCYLIGPDTPGDAVLVDPATFDVTALDIVERHGYYVRAVLLTHCDYDHLDGLQTLLRVYTEAEVYASIEQVAGVHARAVAHGERIVIGGIDIEAILLPGMGRDSVAYRANALLFSGTALTAGESAAVGNPYAKKMLLNDIEQRILVLPEETVVLPFYGPPSTIAVERATLPTGDPTESVGAF